MVCGFVYPRALKEVESHLQHCLNCGSEDYERIDSGEKFLLLGVGDKKELVNVKEELRKQRV